MKSVSQVCDFVIEMMHLHFFHYVCSILFPSDCLQRVSIFWKFGQSRCELTAMYISNIKASDIYALGVLYHIYSL